MKSKLPLVAITMGDPVGIGPEILCKALIDPRVSRCCRPVIYGSAARLAAGARSTGCCKHGIESVASIQEARIENGTVALIDPAANDTPKLKWGEPTIASAMAMVTYLKAAIDDAMAGRIAAIATGPINKHALKMANFHFDGHTEILAQRTGTHDYAMMLAGRRLKVVLATIHISLKDVPSALTTRRLSTVITLTDHALRTRFGIPAPQIAVAGLNPHAGESGQFGSEEATIIAPAVVRCASQGMSVSGPHPPDTVFYRASQGTFDAVVAMYHDQGLGAFKMIHFNDGVNTTLGLPIIRTSVDHGTAYDIAGTGQASAESLVAAITMAADEACCLCPKNNYSSARFF